MSRTCESCLFVKYHIVVASFIVSQIFFPVMKVIRVVDVNL